MYFFDRSAVGAGQDGMKVMMRSARKLGGCTIADATPDQRQPFTEHAGRTYRDRRGAGAGRVRSTEDRLCARVKLAVSTGG